MIAWNVMVIDADEHSYFCVATAYSIRQVLDQLYGLKFNPAMPESSDWRVVQISERPPVGGKRP